VEILESKTGASDSTGASSFTRLACDSLSFTLISKAHRSLSFHRFQRLPIQISPPQRSGEDVGASSVPFDSRRPRHPDVPPRDKPPAPAPTAGTGQDCCRTDALHAALDRRAAPAASDLHCASGVAVVVGRSRPRLCAMATNADAVAQAMDSNERSVEGQQHQEDFQRFIERDVRPPGLSALALSIPSRFVRTSS
jgi:hypothetical protein